MGDWDRPYMTMQPRLRSGAAARVRADPAQRPRLQGPEAGALVPRLPLGARRSGSRVRGSDFARDRRALRASRTSPIWRSASASQAPLRCARQRRDLDHDAVDVAGEPGGRARAGDSLRADRYGLGAGWCSPSDLAAAVLKRAGVNESQAPRRSRRRGARRPAARASVLRAHRAGRARRARHARCRHGRWCTPRPGTARKTTTSA